MTTFQNQVALVTGGSSGIGRATCLAFAREGASVVVSDILEAGGTETVGLIRKIGGNAIFVKADVSNSSEVQNLIETTIRTYGRLDCAFNNAGISGTMATTADCTEENWDNVLAVNLRSIFLCMKYELRQMLKQKQGTIVNCSSIAGLVGFVGSPAYVASKHGIVGLTKTAALEYATSGIRVNAVCPGVIRTPMVEAYTKGHPELEAQFVNAEPVHRLGTPEEIAETVLWLCSNAASFITGQALAVDGGWVAQ